MTEYISRHEAIRALQINHGDYCPTRRALCEIPAADVAEVVHGRWIKDNFLSDDVNNAEKCSQCGESIGWYGNLPNYCPNCGAKMDGGMSDG